MLLLGYQITGVRISTFSQLTGIAGTSVIKPRLHRRVIHHRTISASPHCTENPMFVFPEMKLRGLVPNSYIHVSMSYYIFPRSVCLLGCSKIGRLILGIYKKLTDT
jgi:hypothetical protein